jgi:hypothetical protein
MYGMWGKIKNRGLHLRARPSVGAGRDGHGREYPAYLQAVRNIEDQDRSSDGGESQTSKIVLLGIEEVKDTASMRQALQVETEDERTVSAKGERLMTAMTPKQVEDSLMGLSRKYAGMSNTYGSMDKVINLAATIASIKTQSTVSKELIAVIMSSFAEAKAAIRPELLDSYEEVILWTTISRGFFDETEDKGLPRVQSSLEAALAAVGANIKEEVK